MLFWLGNGGCFGRFLGYDNNWKKIWRLNKRCLEEGTGEYTAGRKSGVGHNGPSCVQSQSGGGQGS